MTKWYRISAIGIICLIIAVPAIAAKIADMEFIEGTPRPFTDVSPLDCCSETVYENTAGPLFSLTGDPRWNLLDDGAFPAGTAPVAVSCFRLGWHQSDTAQIYMYVDFWDDIDPDGPVCNLSYIGGFGVDAGMCPSGAWYGDLILGSPITFPDDTWYYQITFWVSVDPLTPSSTATVLFAGGVTAVGSNDSLVFWLDDDGSYSFECPDEEYTFGTDHNAKFFLRLGADVGPSAVESTTWGGIKALYR